MKEDVAKYRAQLIEEVAGYDEGLLEKFMEDESSHHRRGKYTKHYVLL